MKRISVLIALAAICLLTAPAQAQGPITTTANNFTDNFPTRLVFQLEAQAPTTITQVSLIVLPDGVSASSTQTPEFTSDTQVKVSYDWNLTRNYMPPGVSGQYWWTIQDSAGNQLQTPKQPFRINDPRHQWSKLTNDKLALFWHSGGDPFGKALFDRAIDSMKKLEQDTGVLVDHQIQIFIYADRPEFLRSLGPSVKGSEGGVTFSDYNNGIVLMNVAPSELGWGLGATTHEMTHVIMHQKISSPLGNASFETWMDEGLAMYYETGTGTLDSQFSDPLRRAIQNDTLYSIRTLSGYFSTPSTQELAYGEAYSIVDFIFRNYGRDKTARLLQAIKVGGAPDDIYTQVLGVDRDGLEVEWRKDIGAKPRAIVKPCPTTSPSTIPTLSLSTDFDSAKADATPTPACVPAVALQATLAPKPTAVPQAPANPLTTFCGGAMGLIALGLFGAMKLGWDRRLRM